MEGRIEVKIGHVRKVFPFSSPEAYNQLYPELWERLDMMTGHKKVYLHLKSKGFTEQKEPQTIKEIC